MGSIEKMPNWDELSAILNDVSVENHASEENDGYDDIAHLPKKVQEKCKNLMAHIQSGKTLHVYTRLALVMLKRHGFITRDELIGNYLTKYTRGTSNSQATQIIRLFDHYDIVIERNGKRHLNSNSDMAKAIMRDIT
ncbi:MAG: hypothetical protein ABJG42_24270 [Vibrio splendidus]